MKKKSAQNRKLQDALKIIEAKAERRGLQYRLGHEAKDGTFARVVIAYPEKLEGDKAILAAINGEIYDHIYGILEIQSIDDSIIIDLQGVGGITINTHQNLLFGLLADLLNAGLFVRVDGYTLNSEMVNNAVNAKTEHPAKRERKLNAQKLRQDGFTIEEIAERLGISETTVKRDLRSEKLLRLASLPK